MIITGSQDRSMKIWDAGRGSCIKTMTCYSNLYGASISEEDSFLASAHFDGHLRVWAPTTGEMIQDLQLHEMPITCVAFS
mmetsp:Transcript_4767/g.633  ORF Transcript_4767/g.633 Transcript_4767/m.633 type:complete len:80 (-) Transcript_4767:373-612(-)